MKLEVSDKTQPKRRMPLGKEQFGIIVRTDIHRRARQLAADRGCRISAIYAEGVLKVCGEETSAKERDAAELVREITIGVPESQWSYFREMAAFLTARPDTYRMQVLSAVLNVTNILDSSTPKS